MYKYKKLTKTKHCATCKHGNRPAGSVLACQTGENGMGCPGFEQISFNTYKERRMKEGRKTVPAVPAGYGDYVTGKEYRFKNLSRNRKKGAWCAIFGTCCVFLSLLALLWLSTEAESASDRMLVALMAGFLTIGWAYITILSLVKIALLREHAFGPDPRPEYKPPEYLPGSDTDWEEEFQERDRKAKAEIKEKVEACFGNYFNLRHKNNVAEEACIECSLDSKCLIVTALRKQLGEGEDWRS